jgi:4-hydroxy-2-oxoheptanedioate aldolase
VAEPFKHRLASARPQIGMWVVTASPYCAEVCAGGGLDWLLIDMEHAPNDLASVLAQLQAVAPYPVSVVVRPPAAHEVVIKQLLDIGVQNLLLPMVESAAQAEQLVRATRYPPGGDRGVGTAFARASRWNRRTDYLKQTDEEICLLMQVESTEGLRQLESIAAVDGVDGVFIGPADLAASMGHLGRPDHPEVVEQIEGAITRLGTIGVAAGVNAFKEATARRAIELGCRFLLVGADVTMLARGSEELAARYGTGRPA